jgi:tRNA(Ile)-lysidine synthase TilS/MesJ
MGSLNYPEWRERHRKALESFPDKSVMMFFSGGRDSSVVLHFLQQAGREFGFSFDVRAGVFPHHVYTPEVRTELDRYWKGRGITVNWHEIRESDESLKAAADEGTSPCLICNTSKKRDLMAYFKTQGTDLNRLVVVLSYSLYDLVSASVEHILGAVFADRNAKAAVRYKSAEERFAETAQRFYPLLRMPNGFTVFKPLIHYNDPDIMAVLESEKIPVLPNRCEYKPYRPKRHFAQYYEKMGLRFDYEAVFAFAREALELPGESVFTGMDREHYLSKVI